MKKKMIILALIATVLLSSISSVFAEDNSARITEIETQIAELRTELNELKRAAAGLDETTLYQDENLIITYDGIEGTEDDYDVMFIIENISDRTLTVQVREVSINGFMVDPTCSIEIAPGKKAKDGMNIWGDDAEITPMSETENVETKFHIFDANDWEYSYDTENVIIM